MFARIRREPAVFIAAVAGVANAAIGLAAVLGLDPKVVAGLVAFVTMCGGAITRVFVTPVK